jgi:hypothetical protein
MIKHHITFKDKCFLFDMYFPVTLSVCYETVGDDIKLISASLSMEASETIIITREKMDILQQWLSAPIRRDLMLKEASRHIEQLKADSKALGESQANDHYADIRHRCSMARRADR